jgi:hypothetical protein
MAAQTYIFAAAGETIIANKYLENLLEVAKTRYVSACDIATIYAALGDSENAFKWLDIAMEERAVWLVLLKSNPRFESLRQDSRFDNILKRIGSPE